MGYPCLSLHEGRTKATKSPTSMTSRRTSAAFSLPQTRLLAAWMGCSWTWSSAMTLPTIMRSIYKDWDALVGHHTVCLRSWVHTERVHHMNPVIVNV